MKKPRSQARSARSTAAAFDVVLGFDMETDIGSFTPFYEGVKHGTTHLLKLLKKHGIRATFYWTGHAAATNPGIVRRVRDAGHETGCHGLYHETLGDPLFPLPNNWPILPSEVEGRLREATRIVRKASGERPISFRCPRLWGSTNVLNVLEKLGYTTDASFPLYFFRKPFAPYHPSARDWTRPGRMRILEIPNFCDLSMESHDPYQRDRDQWPLFRTESAEALVQQGGQFHRLRRGPQAASRPVLLSASLGIPPHAAGRARFRRVQRENAAVHREELRPEGGQATRSGLHPAPGAWRPVPHREGPGG